MVLLFAFSKPISEPGQFGDALREFLRRAGGNKIRKADAASLTI
jgi:hypothetical protein